MEQKKIITLDLTDCKYLGEIHERIRVTFDFPEWYSANWDAFWDLLWSTCDADVVKILGESTLPKSFQLEIEMMHKMLSEYKQERLIDSDHFNDINPFEYYIES